MSFFGGIIGAIKGGLTHPLDPLAGPKGFSKGQHPATPTNKQYAAALTAANAKIAAFQDSLTVNQGATPTPTAGTVAAAPASSSWMPMLLFFGLAVVVVLLIVSGKKLKL